MQVLTSDSLEILRRAATERPEIVESDFAELSAQLNLKFVEIALDLDTNFMLLMPTGISQDQNMDNKNCIIITQHLSQLSPAEATDERLWTTLCFRELSKYVNVRWPLARAHNPVNYVNDHWFAKNNRNRIRDNAISRLWWMGRIANLVPGTTFENVLDTLFFNSDYRSSLIERSSSASALNVVAVILQISQKYFSTGHEYNRDSFRSFMKAVDMMGKRANLTSLDDETLNSLLEPLYREAYSIK